MTARWVDEWHVCEREVERHRVERGVIYIYIQRPRYSTKTKQQKRHTLTSLCNEIRVYKLYSGTGRPRIGEGKDNKGQRKTKTETLNWTCSKLSRGER
jgi:hypothetical protein